VTCAPCRTWDRRAFLGLLATGLAAAVAGCGATEARRAVAGQPAPTTLPPPSTTTTTTAPPVVTLGAIPPPTPGAPTVVSQGPPPAVAARQVAITIDDGYCQPCAQAYAEFAAATGTHLTFSPNGTYAPIWSPLAETLRPLIERGQVQIGNHTYSHQNPTRLSDAQLTAELERNDEWIQQTFGITSRPWWRPPYGYHNTRTDTVAGEAGYTRVLMWNGTYGDSTLLTPQELMASAQQYLQPGTIVLGHANHPTVTELFGPISQLIASRQLTPVTLDEMFGTSRMVG
jgi:peptidoglycan/xylan/chitin deacetylase (PgdA/CDA1 family)